MSDTTSRAEVPQDGNGRQYCGNARVGWSPAKARTLLPPTSLGPRHDRRHDVWDAPRLCVWVGVTYDKVVRLMKEQTRVVVPRK